MKVLNVVILLTAIITVSCKTQKIAPKPEPVKSEAVVSHAGNAIPASPAVTSKEEWVTAAKGEANDLGLKRFYIILGSFGVYENAQKFKKQLMAKNFFPGILVNKANLYRVSVDSYDDEATARSRVSDIRQKFPEYSDLWLLIKK